MGGSRVSAVPVVSQQPLAGPPSGYSLPPVQAVPTVYSLAQDGEHQRYHILHRGKHKG